MLQLVVNPVACWVCHAGWQDSNRLMVMRDGDVMCLHCANRPAT